jgi:glutamate synthase (NADPH/NADH) small chain
MGKLRGYLETDRKLPPKRPVEDRVNDWREVYLEQPEEALKEQAGRCMDCGVPFCQQGCPLGNHIPTWNDQVTRGQWEQAWRQLSATNNFPEFTGRLCPAPCEAACTLAINTGAVTIEEVEKQIVERAHAEGWAQPRPRRPLTGKRVAVVGSGPAGLAAAEQLTLAGHDVTVFERSDRIGGLLRYGIPDFKMEKWVIDRRLAILEAEGIEFRTGVDVGTDVSWKSLDADYDAILVAVGAMKARDLEVEGRDLDGVHFAMEYLEQGNRAVAGDTIPEATRIDAKGKHVVVLGGGDTGSDCVGTANRQGAASVRQIEIMPQPPETRDADNPWPQWPMVFRTSTSHEEGVEREYALMTTRVEGEGGRVTRLHAVEVKLDKSGIHPVEGTEHSFDCDLLVLAMGFTGPIVDTLKEELGADLTSRGTVDADKGFHTTAGKVWVAGDAFRGASLIVWAISDGREAARSIDATLMGGETALPTRGINQSFGGR